jgi:hypothetical protein
VVLLSVLRNNSLPPHLVAGISYTYLAFILYTWVATPLVNVWVRVRPPR